MAKKHWISGAIDHPGVFKEDAKKAGMTTHEYAEKHKNDKGTLGRRARLAITLMGMHHGGSDKPKPRSSGSKMKSRYGEGA